MRREFVRAARRADLGCGRDRTDLRHRRLRPATVDSIAQRDYALLQGVVLVVAVGYVFVNLVVDLTYSLINPRIRVAGTGS